MSSAEILTSHCQLALQLTERASKATVVLCFVLLPSGVSPLEGLSCRMMRGSFRPGSDQPATISQDTDAASPRLGSSYVQNKLCPLINTVSCFSKFSSPLFHLASLFHEQRNQHPPRQLLYSPNVQHHFETNKDQGTK